VGLDFDVLADFARDRILKFGGEPMSVAERHRAVDLKIERNGLARFDILDGDVVHRQAAARGDHQHPREDRLVVERERVGGDGQFSLRPFPGDTGLELGLDPGHAFERQSARHRDDDVAHDLRPAWPKANGLDPRDARVVHDQALDRIGQPLRRAVDKRVDCRPAQAIA
jgi:hypothetical protein